VGRDWLLLAERGQGVLKFVDGIFPVNGRSAMLGIYVDGDDDFKSLLENQVITIAK